MSLNKAIWDTQENAEAYDNYARNFPMYQETSADLVEIAGLKPGMKVIDLAAGTGATTQAILAKIGDQGKVMAVDQADEMLKKAQEKFGGKNVGFIVAEAESLDQVIQEPVDGVICNSAFWQMKAPETFQAIARVLKPGGIFAFNLPNQFFNDPDFIKHSRNAIPYESTDLVAWGQAVGLNLETKIIKTYTKLQAERLAFQEIPVMRRNFSTKEERDRLVDKLKGESAENVNQEQQWAHFVFRKS